MIARSLLAGFMVILSAAGVGSTAGPPFQFTASLDRFFGRANGTLVFADESIAFRAPAPKNSHEWKYADLKQVRILSPRRIQLNTYEEQGRLHLGADRAYTFDVTEPVSSELVGFLHARIDRPIVTAVMPPLPSTPLFRAAVKHAQGRGGSEGVLMLYDGGLAYAARQDDDARFWRFRDIFAVLALDPFRLQVLAYEGGSGRTRAFTFDLKETLPAGMYDALWQRVNRPNRRPYSVGTDMEVTAMNRSMMAGVLALGIATGGSQASAIQDSHQHVASAQADPMAMCHKMMADMDANTTKLEELASKMNSSSGQAKMTAMSDLLNALVKERTAMKASMKDMQPGSNMAGMQMSDEMKAMHATMSAQNQAMDHAAHQQAAEPTLTFATEPKTPVAGENTFTVTVKDKDGKPVTGATVSAEFMMPAMPGMRKPVVALTAPMDPKVAAEGAYTGKGRLSMSGKWSVTITVRVDDKVFAEKTVAIEAK